MNLMIFIPKIKSLVYLLKVSIMLVVDPKSINSKKSKKKEPLFKLTLIVIDVALHILNYAFGIGIIYL